MKKMRNKLLVGAIERCDLPELNIHNLAVRIDTGAATSSLHVDNIKEFYRPAKPGQTPSTKQILWIGFDIHPDYHDVSSVVHREAKVKSKRRVKSSNAKAENRYVIHTTLVMDGEQWVIELTLTDRSNMNYLMLLGRQAMAGRFVVDPDESYLLECIDDPP